MMKVNYAYLKAKLLIQLAIIMGVSYLGNVLQQLFHIPLAGSIVGLILFYFLLQFKIIKLQWVKDGSDFFLKSMVFFFIPSVVGIMDIVSNINFNYVIFFFVIIIGTSLVALISGYIAETMVKKPMTGKGNSK